MGGGFVAVTYFHNRESTEDLDYLLDPTLPNLAKIEEKLINAISRTATKHKYEEDWANDKIGMFAVGDTALPLFQKSLAQNAILWEGKNLVIYALDWEWLLARKVKRIGSTKRWIDISDAATLLKKLVGENGGPISRERAKGWNEIVYTPIEDEALDMVDKEYEKMHGSKGFI